jgi:hypothetical protein
MARAERDLLTFLADRDFCGESGTIEQRIADCAYIRNRTYGEYDAVKLVHSDGESPLSLLYFDSTTKMLAKYVTTTDEHNTVFGRSITLSHADAIKECEKLNTSAPESSESLGKKWRLMSVEEYKNFGGAGSFKPHSSLVGVNRVFLNITGLSNTTDSEGWVWLKDDAKKAGQAMAFRAERDTRKAETGLYTANKTDSNRFVCVADLK